MSTFTLAEKHLLRLQCTLLEFKILASSLNCTNSTHVEFIDCKTIKLLYVLAVLPSLSRAETDAEFLERGVKPLDLGKCVVAILAN